MTTFRHPNGKAFHYDFWWRGDRYTGNTLQTTKADADIVEADIKKKLRLRAGGLEPATPAGRVPFQEWAEIYLEHVRTREKRRIKRPERIEDLLRVLMRFWGRKPLPAVTGKLAARAGAPYRDLALNDPIDDPKLLLEFEDWMEEKAIAGQTRNQYRSTMSQMYALALHPAYRKRTGVMMNPFLGVPRDSSADRTSTVTIDELRAWLQNASYHVRVALAVAALAPKLRLANVLALRFDRHIDFENRLIVVHEHKTDASGKPLVVPIDDQLLDILKDARRRFPRAKYVITYQGKPVKSIRGGVKAAAADAGLKWGRFLDDGITFHSMRHTMATMLAELQDLDGQPAVSESVRKNAMGHERLETTQRYTHIRPAVERRVLERLSKVTPIADLVMKPGNRAQRKKRTTGINTGTDKYAGRKFRGKTSKSGSRPRRPKLAV